MTPIEIMATIFAVLILVKMITLLINPKAWMKSVANPLLNNVTPTMAIYLIFAIITGYYILQEMNIIQIAAVMLFTSLLFGLNLMPYAKEFLKMANKTLKTRKQMLKTWWLHFILWIGFALWVLYELFW